MTDLEEVTVEEATPPKGKEEKLRADGGFPADYDPSEDPGPERVEDTPEFLKKAYPDLKPAPTSSKEN